MPNLLVSGFETPWTSTNPARLAAATDPFSVAALASLRLAATENSSGVAAEYVPASPVNLSMYDELRFWVNADRAADGTPDRPFFLELCLVQAGVERRWLVPVNEPGVWEHHRIGLTG